MTLRATVVIPVRNEEDDIEDCLRAVADQRCGAAGLEVIVADGRSADATRDVLARIGDSLGFGRFAVVDNPAGGIAAGLNRALREATTPVVARVDARSRIGPDHVAVVLDILAGRPDVGVVGGAQVPTARGTSAMERAIARSLGNRYTTGLGRYRRTTADGPADTVWLGAFRTGDLRRLGGWDERLPVNEDYELCERFRAAGATVWLVGALEAWYLPRRHLSALARQYARFGWTKGRRWRAGSPLGARHVVLLAAPPTAAAGAWLAARRLGLWPAVGFAVGGVLAVDAVGAREPAPMRVRCLAVVATVTTNLVWWTSVVAGFLAGSRFDEDAHTGGAG